jgi:hypothetical protein
MVNKSPSNPEIVSVVNKYLEIAKVGRSKVRAFALALNVSYSAVSNWSTGKSIPSPFLLFNFREQYKDWRWDFATEVLNIMLPESANSLSDRDGNHHNTIIDQCEVCGADRIGNKAG